MTPATTLVANNNRVRGKKPKSKFMAKLEDPMQKDEITSRRISTLDQEMDAYMTLKYVVPDEDKEISAIHGALYFYQLYERSFLLLAKVAHSMLAITATSVPSECLFSKAGRIETYLRNRLNPSTVGNITFIKSNM